MRIAVVHDWLTSYGGAERVLAEMLSVFPEADLFVLVDFLPAEQRGFLNGRRPVTSLIQRLPFARKHFRAYLPLFPFAIEQLSLSDYDVVVSSSYAVAKGVLTRPDQLHICYCHSPMRYAWDLQDTYLRERGLSGGIRSLPVRYALHRLRQWDRLSSFGVDEFIANSAFVGRRIMRCYRRDCAVIHPPVDINAFALNRTKDDYYLVVSRLAPYKRVPLIVRAFLEMRDKKLIVVGEGPDYAAAKALADGSTNIRVLGYQPQAKVVDFVKRARAFVFAAEEDFGIAVLEASACGTPVIALDAGGARETVRDISKSNPTGVLFPEPTIAGICSAVRKFEREGQRISPEDCQRFAAQFGPERFRAEFRDFVMDAWDGRANGAPGLRAQRKPALPRLSLGKIPESSLAEPD